MRRALPILAFLLAGPALAAAPPGPAVVELFQSQGCSSCPPANVNVMALADRPGVLTLSFQVTYWDQLGWKDTFADMAYTRRQSDYARDLGHDTVATPDVMVDGRVDLSGLDRAKLAAAVAAAGPTGGGVVLSDRSVALPARERLAAPADVWLVRYDPRVVQIAVKRGENGGKTLPHRNVVRTLRRLGTWSGAAESFSLPRPADPAWKTAVLVQRPGGAILMAAAG